ncbi:MAG: hypothetical protein NVSMB32_04520 [Actinomycetota bacterium]
MVLAFALAVLTAILGPSAAVVPLRTGSFPPGFSLHPAAWLVTALLGSCVVASVGATWAAWAALRAGWAPSPRRLLAGGLLGMGVLMFLPPVAGADVLSYAAYGHMAARGQDPYTVRPDHLPGDPFARAVEDPWRSTPSVYGPLASAEQRLLVGLAGNNLRRAVGLLDLVNGLAFGVAAWLLFVLAGPDDGRRRRAVLSFALNPILVLVVVAEAHIDALVVLAVVGALALVRRSPLAAGIVGGLGVLIKLTAGLPLAGWAWYLRWSPAARPGLGGRAQVPGGRRLIGLAGGAGAVVVAGYATVGLHALNQARRASSFVSVGTPWRPVRAGIQALAGHHVASLAVSVGAALLAVWLAVVLGRSLPAVGAESDGDAAPAARAALVVVLAWTLAAPYVLGWYDAVPWALLALLPVSRHHKILLVHTGMLALAYLPGRVVPLPAVLSGLTTVVRSAVSPAVLAALVAAALLPHLRLRQGRQPSELTPQQL